MSGSLPMAIDCRNLTYRYGKFTAVDDLTLQVRPGETMGLLGPNGAGKTTLVRMLTTLTPVQEGELRIFGMDSSDETVDIRSNIGYVPQQLSIEPALTGRQNVEWFARLYGVPRAQRAERADQATGRHAIGRRGRPTGRDLFRRHGAPPGGGPGTGQPSVAAGA